MAAISSKHYIGYFCKILGLLLVVSLSLGGLTSWNWLHQNNELHLNTVMKLQNSTTGQDDMVLFDPALKLDIYAYKLNNYGTQKPFVVNIGSSQVLPMRARYFAQSFYNMGGTATSLQDLHRTLQAMLRLHKPKTLLVGIDPRWFLPSSSNTTRMHMRNLSMPTAQSLGAAPSDVYIFSAPWQWLVGGTIEVKDFFSPKEGALYANARYGSLAKKYSSGFTPEGAFVPTGIITAQKAAPDVQFAQSHKELHNGKGMFSLNTQELPEPMLDYLAEIACMVRSRGIEAIFYIPPMAPALYTALQEHSPNYSHIFSLPTALRQRGIDVMDFSDTRALEVDPTLAQCEFVDGLHGGEILFARMLYAMGKNYVSLRSALQLELLEEHMQTWQGHAMVPDARITYLVETDFLQLSCPKR